MQVTNDAAAVFMRFRACCRMSCPREHDQREKRPTSPGQYAFHNHLTCSDVEHVVTIRLAR